MFNEAVLEEFVKADPGINVPLMDKEHLVKPIQMKIVNGRVKKNKKYLQFKFEDDKFFCLCRSKMSPSASRNLCGLSTSSAPLPPNCNCSSMELLVSSTKKSTAPITPRTPSTTPWR